MTASVGSAAFYFPIILHSDLWRTEAGIIKPHYSSGDNEENRDLLGCCCGGQNLSQYVSQNKSRKHIVN